MTKNVIQKFVPEMQWCAGWCLVPSKCAVAEKRLGSTW